jgi:hypothetical protein
VGIPSVHVLAHHNAVNAYVPHLGRTVPTGLQLVINLLTFIGSFGGGTPFVNAVPFFRTPWCIWKQPGIVLTAGVKRSSVFGGGAGFRAGVGSPALHHRTSPLMPFLGMIETVMLHLLTAGTNRDAIGRNLNITISFQVLRAAYIEIDKRFNMLVEQEIIDGPGIMGGIEQHPV